VVDALPHSGPPEDAPPVEGHAPSRVTLEQAGDGPEGSIASRSEGTVGSNPEGTLATHPEGSVGSNPEGTPEEEQAGSERVAQRMRAALRVPPADLARRPQFWLATMVAGYIGLFGFLVYRQQSNFGTFGYDLGMHDQAIWLLSRFEGPWDTVRGLDYFGQHINVISALFVPAYWLGAGPHFLGMVHTTVVALCAVPLWLLARDRLTNPWAALVLPLAWLLHPAVDWVTWWTYHPDSLSMLPLFWGYWFATRRRWKAFAIAIGFALICKEDDALAVLMLGVVMALWRRATTAGPGPGERPARRAGIITAATGATWYVLCTKVLIPPLLGGAAPFYNNFFPALGNSIPEVIKNAIIHPSRVWKLATLPNRRHWSLQMIGPLAFLPLLALPALLIAGPQIGVDVTAQVVDGATIASEYASLPLVGAFLAATEALGFIYRHQHRVADAAAGLLVGAAVAGSVAWGLAPWSLSFHNGTWSSHNSQSPQLHQALRMAGPSAGISVTYFVTPHVTHRKLAYEFPNPWINANFGLNHQTLGDPAQVKWILVAKQTLGPREVDLLNELTAPGGQFKIVLDQNGVVLAERDKPNAPLPDIAALSEMPT
jgi:uncharacterized membrane protein